MSIKKSLTSIIAGIFAFGTLSTGLICSADETSAVTTTVSTVTNYENTTSAVTTTVDTNTYLNETTTSINSDVTTDTQSSTTTTTPIQTTTSSNATTTTSVVTTTTTPIITTTEVTTYMGQETEYIFDEIDKILYDTELTSEMKIKNINSYLQKKVISYEIPVNVALEITRNTKSILNEQDRTKLLNESINQSINSYLDSVTVQNSKSIQTYCSNLIKNSFKNGLLKADETIKFIKSVQDKILNIASTKALESSESLEKSKSDYVNYQFTSNKNVVSQINYGYPDLQGWIYIPNANIDYPILHSSEDNDYYLQHDINGFGSSQGCIELDYRCDFGDVTDTTDYTSNRLFYGHNLSNGLMFSNLERYKDPNYWNDNRLIEITTTQDQRLYEIYACCSIYGMADGTDFKYWDPKYINMDEELFNEHMVLTQQTMLYSTDNFPVFGQDIITLQTCDGDDGWRIVLFAKRVK